MGDSLFTPEQRKFNRQISAILMPNFHENYTRLYPNGEDSPPALFAHYTSADAALKILGSKRLWMRSTTCMADYREVSYGYGVLTEAFSKDNLGIDFRAALDKCFPGAAQAGVENFERNWKSILLGTYVACLSEHDAKENVHGRLSMWRGFAANSPRVAIVVSIPFFSTVSEKLQVMFSPVGYFGSEGICAEIRRVIKCVEDNQAILKQLSPQMYSGWIFALLLAAVTCMKHDGFEEEREWRAVYFPQTLPEQSGLIKLKTELIAGVPQKVFELPLDKSASEDLAEIDLAKMLHHVIIGPSQYGHAMSEAFVDALTALGVPDPRDRVVVSGIPIRT